MLFCGFLVIDCHADFDKSARNDGTLSLKKTQNQKQTPSKTKQHNNKYHNKYDKTPKQHSDKNQQNLINII